LPASLGFGKFARHAPPLSEMGGNTLRACVLPRGAVARHSELQGIDFELFFYQEIIRIFGVNTTTFGQELVACEWLVLD
jgi:hypothetical protein